MKECETAFLAKLFPHEKHGHGFVKGLRLLQIGRVHLNVLSVFGISNKVRNLPATNRPNSIMTVFMLCSE